MAWADFGRSDELFGLSRRSVVGGVSGPIIMLTVVTQHGMQYIATAAATGTIKIGMLWAKTGPI